MYSEIAANKRKTWFIMTGFIAFIVALGWVFSVFIGKPAVTPFVLIAAAIYALISYFMGSRMALAVNGAKEISKQDNLRLWRIVENLAITDGLPMPKVYIMNDPAPNAFATGRNPSHSAVCCTSGILEIMTDTELEGVLAHELGHVKNYDIRVSMIAFALVAVVGIIADTIMHLVWFSDDDDVHPAFYVLGIVAAIIAPFVATLIQLAVSRRREYLADATGAMTTRHPDGLASALEKISTYGSAMQRQNTSTAHLFFANPLKPGVFASWFSTHPPIQDRINRLRQMNTKV